MKETIDQAAAIAARGKTIVSASAGSGKTRVMVERYIQLVASGEAKVENMLAVTFTNKAAAQMRDRIRKALLDTMRKADHAARERLRAALRALPLADISTIHAFCGRLIRTYFYLLELDPAFRIVGADDAEGKALSQRAMDATFEAAYDNAEEGFSRLLAVYFRKKKDAQLRKMVHHIHTAARIEPDYRATLEKIAAGEEDLFEKACAMLAQEYRRRANRFLVQLEFFREKVSAAPPNVQAYYGAIWEASNAILSAPDIFAMQKLFAEVKLTKPRKNANTLPETEELLSHLQKLAKRLKAEVLKGIKEYDTREVEYAHYKSAQEQARALAALTLAYDERFTAVKREAGVLDYGDLEQYTLKLIGMPEVRDSIHAKYKFVFVDEYQDVNPMQERILFEVASEDVFLVGDEKQAIYGFRGSNSKYFTKKAEAFQSEGNSLQLNENFRSANAILTAVNTVFSAALKKYTPMQGGALYRNYTGEVYVHNLSQEEEDCEARTVYSVREAAANPSSSAIACKVVSIVEEECGRKEGLGRNWFNVEKMTKAGVSEKEALCPVRYGDIAVLVRKNTKSAGPIVHALSERGIPVTTSAEVNICEFFEVRLLIDWLSFLDNAEQDIPMASAMLSLIGGFTDAELARIRLKVEKTLRQHGLSFRAACRAYLQGYQEGNDLLCKKLERFFEISARYRALAQVRTASEMIVLLLADGLEAQIAAKGASESRLARVQRFLTESVGCGTTHDFLRRLKDSEYNVEYSEAGGENAVHVITMHSAKGLEFPVVILVELDSDFTKSAAVFKPEIEEVKWTNAFHLAPRYFDLQRKVYYDTVIRKAAALFARRQALEGERNLLYVAMTRAYCRLHMIFEGGWECPESEEDEARYYTPDDAKRLSDFVPRTRLMSWINASAKEEIWEHEERRALEYLADEQIVNEIVRAGAPYPYLASTLVPVKDSATGLMRKIGHTMYKNLGAEDESTMSEIEAEVADVGGSFNAETGVAYHAFLEHVNFGKDVEEELCRMQKEHLLGDEQISLLDIERLKSILTMPVFSELEGKKTWREQRFLVKFPACAFEEAYDNTSAQDDVIFQGAIDLLVEEGEGRYTVVDYKFSSLSDQEIRQKYAVQMKLYKKTVVKIMECDEADVRVRIVNIARISELEI